MTVNYGNEVLADSDAMPYQFSKQSYRKESDRQDVGDYQYDADLSNENTAVYHDQKNRKSHVSNRGSKTLYDWGVSDLQIATGMEAYGKRFHDSVDITRKAHEKFGFDVDTSGHSLGGSASSYTTQQLGNESWYGKGTSFNMGSSALGRDSQFSAQRSACASKTPPKFCAKMTNVKQAGDYISGNSAAFGNTKTYHAKRGVFNRLARFVSPTYRFAQNLSQHSLSNFSLPQ